MRVVVYADDFEPITVIKLDQWAVDFLRTTDRICLYTEPDWMLDVWEPEDEPISMKIMHVVLHAVWFHRRGRWGDTDRNAGLILMADDHENALQLRSIFLAGQQRLVREREDIAFARGALTMFGRMGGLNDGG